MTELEWNLLPGGSEPYIYGRILYEKKKDLRFLRCNDFRIEKSIAIYLQLTIPFLFCKRSKDHLNHS